MVHGRATGKLTWKRDATGKLLDSDGELALDGARLDDLSPFRQLALLHGNTDLTDFAFDTAACTFHVHQNRARLELHAAAAGKLTLAGLGRLRPDDQARAGRSRRHRSAAEDVAAG